ncbi:MAG: FAD-dependent oxidoreductase, partial [Verrucomicrobiota bacterium]|nr:FAD-dependent oxidoreductase [Verrucomicrobiota bacterium]
MNRRNFIHLISTSGAAFSSATLFFPKSARGAEEKSIAQKGKQNFSADLIIVGGGLGGCAAALAALKNNLSVILTEETDWIGGQLTQQGVPPDEHRWIESFGSTRVYREFRRAIRDFYRRNYPLTEAARARV